MRIPDSTFDEGTGIMEDEMSTAIQHYDVRINCAVA